MDAVEFIKTWARICREYGDCKVCILSDFCDHSCYTYDNYQVAEQTVANVLEWVKENPVKTRQSEFLRMFPNAQKSSNGVLDICPRKVEPEKYKGTTPDKICINSDTLQWCDECRSDFWLKEI